MEDYGERATTEHKNLSDKFHISNPDYNKQYCSIYLTRMKQQEEYLLSRISSKWGDKYPICQLHKLAEQKTEKCFVIGTLFKDQKLKPSVVKQLAESNQLVPQPILTHFTDESDLLYIEDKLQRYQILGSLACKKVVTGITCALLGTDMGNGKFMVEKCIFANYRPQVERPLMDDSSYIVIISGLDFVNHENFIINLELFSNWLSGLLGECTYEVNKIVRVIIAGNSVRFEREVITTKTISMTSKIIESQDTIDAVKSLDYFLLQLCEVIDVDIMPGENDPSNHILPQKPMHYCMFPKSYTYKSFNPVTNPYYCSVGDVKILGNSGQPVTDILRNSEIADPLEAMEECLNWNHMAPTAPDTLGCFPFYEKDPFVIDDCPHVMFAGNQDKFDTKMVTGDDGQTVRLISIPKFCQTFQAVVLNLKTLDCNSIVFNAKK